MGRQTSRHYGENLLFNGDAESNSGTDGFTPDRGIAWWWDPDRISLGIYGSHPDFPGLASPGPAERGSKFFLGGTASAVTTQTLPVSHLAADNLSFVLQAPAAPPLVISAITPIAQGWQVEFESRTTLRYELHRSTNLRSWSKVDGPTAGNGGLLTLADPSMPDSPAFYQVIGLSP